MKLSDSYTQLNQEILEMDKMAKKIFKPILSDCEENPYADYDPEENVIEDSNSIDDFDDNNDFDDEYGNQSSFEPIKRQRPDGWN